MIERMEYVWGSERNSIIYFFGVWRKPVSAAALEISVHIELLIRRK